MANPKTGIRKTMQPGWTFPIPLVARFLVICERKMIKPSTLISQILLQWVEENE